MNTGDFIILSISALLFGILLGAYLGTVLYRLKEGVSFATLKCFCPHCRHELKLWEQTPVVGFLILRGRCRYCQKPISPAYPLREAGCGLYYFVTFILFYNSPVIMFIFWAALPIVLFLYTGIRFKVKIGKALINLLSFTLPYVLLVLALCYVSIGRG